MKILLVNNNTQHLDHLKKSLIGHQLEIQDYYPGLNFHLGRKDAVILSGGGGEGLEIHDEFERGKLWYQDQIKLVRETCLPLLGICMGFEVICKAYNQQVVAMPKTLTQFVDLQAGKAGQQLLGKTKLRQYEAHEWNVPEIFGNDLEELARSPRDVQIIRHRKKKILGTQFHPEVSGGSLPLNDFLTMVTA